MNVTKQLCTPPPPPPVIESVTVELTASEATKLLSFLQSETDTPFYVARVRHSRVVYPLTAKLERALAGARA